MNRYEPHEIEARWQRVWDDEIPVVILAPGLS